jgi:hypothetical protein
MTPLDVVFRLGRPPGAPEMQGIYQVREVYGIRKISFDGKAAVRVEYDASRLAESTVVALLRHAGLDVREKDIRDKVALV